MYMLCRYVSNGKWHMLHWFTERYAHKRAHRMHTHTQMQMCKHTSRRWCVCMLRHCSLFVAIFIVVCYCHCSTSACCNMSIRIHTNAHLHTLAFDYPLHTFRRHRSTYCFGDTAVLQLAICLHHIYLATHHFNTSFRVCHNARSLVLHIHTVSLAFYSPITAFVWLSKIDCQTMNSFMLHALAAALSLPFHMHCCDLVVCMCVCACIMWFGEFSRTHSCHCNPMRLLYTFGFSIIIFNFSKILHLSWM